MTLILGNRADYEGPVSIPFDRWVITALIYLVVCHKSGDIVTEIAEKAHNRRAVELILFGCSRDILCLTCLRIDTARYPIAIMAYKTSIRKSVTV